MNLTLSAARTVWRVIARHPLAALLTIYGALAILYGAVTPIFETPDESTHFAVVQYIARTGRLPVQDPSQPTPWQQEGSQPPLFYLIAAPIADLVPGALDNPYPLARNPHAQIGIGLATINHNLFVHTSDEAFPWYGAALAVHLIRLLSTLFGALTIVCIYRLARRLWPESPGWAALAAGFVALNPMFLFIDASVSNDALITALSAAATLLIFNMFMAEGQSHIRETILLSGIMAAAAIAKVSGLTLYAVAGAALAIALFHRRVTFGQALLHSGIWLVGFAVIAAWWYMRNIQLYGDPTGLSAMIQIAVPRRVPYTFWTFLNEMEGLRISSWALFGWFNVIGPSWLYPVMDWLTGLALIGGILGAARLIWRRDWVRLAVIGLLAWQFVVTFSSLIAWTRLTPGTQGRLLFPALPAIALLTIFGWQTLFRHRISWLGVVPLAIVATAAPLAIIAPAYSPPPPVALNGGASFTFPPDVRAIKAQFDSITVSGIKIGSVIIANDGLSNGLKAALPITFYYSGTPDPRNLSLFVTVYDCQHNVIGKLDTYPGGGNLPTSQWISGALYADSYRLPIVIPAILPCQPYVEFGWWNYATKEYLTELAGQKGLRSLTVRGGAIIDPRLPDPPPAILQTADFGGMLHLRGYTLDTTAVVPGQTFNVTFDWLCSAPIAADLTVFVHLEPVGQNDQPPLGQGDSPPRKGDYPTSVCAVGLPFADSHSVQVKADAPPSRYQLAVGWYRPDTQMRLALSGGGDTLVLSTPITVAAMTQP